MRRGPSAVVCPSCGTSFEPPSSMAGGFAACPTCRQAVPVPARGPEPLFWALLGGAALVLVGVSVAVATHAGTAAGAVVFGVGGVIIAIAVIAS